MVRGSIYTFGVDSDGPYLGLSIEYVNLNVLHLVL
jgi:hypothetical protein